MLKLLLHIILLKRIKRNNIFISMLFAIAGLGVGFIIHGIVKLIKDI